MGLTSSVFSALERPQIAWTADSRGFHRGAPCVAQDRVILNVTPQGGVADARLEAVDRDGTLLWQSPTKTAMEAQPLVAGERVYAPSPDGLVCVSAHDGSPVWKTDAVEMMGWLPPGQDAWEADGGVGRAALSPDGSTVYFGLVEGTLVALDADTGEKRWHRPLPQFMNRPAPVVTPEGTVVCNADNGYVAALSPAGEVAWERRLGREVSAPLLAQDGTAVFATREGQVLGVDLATGQEVREFALPGRVVRQAPVAAGDRLLVASEGEARDGRLHCLEEAPGGYREVWSVDLPGKARAVAVDPQGLIAVACGDRGVRFFEPEGRAHGMVADEDARALVALDEGTFLAFAGDRVDALRPTLQALAVEEAALPGGSIQTDGAWVTIGSVSLQVR